MIGEIIPGAQQSLYLKHLFEDLIIIMKKDFLVFPLQGKNKMNFYYLNVKIMIFTALTTFMLLCH